MALEKLEVSIIQHQMNLKKSKSDMNKILSEKEGECDQIRLSTQKSVNEIQLKLECEIRSRSEAVKEKKSQGYNATKGPTHTCPGRSGPSLYPWERQEIAISNIEAELLINQQQVAEVTRHNKELQVQIKDRETDFHQNEVMFRSMRCI